MNVFDKYGEKTEPEIIKSLNDGRLIYITPSSEGFFDTVLNFNTDNEEIRNFKEDVKEVKRAELTPFWRPIMDPSIEGGKVVYKKGNKPAIGYSFNQWRQMISKMPAVEGKTWKVGTVYQYYAFLVWLINKLVESYGWSVKDAMEAVVLDSKELGHYYNSKNAMHDHDYETTGSREICGVFDLGNTFKIIDFSIFQACEFVLAGGFYHNCGDFYPLADLHYFSFVFGNRNFSVGWLVLS